MLVPHPSSPAPGEPFDLDFSGFRGTSHDWITIVAKDAPVEQYGEWFYTDGQTSGRRSFQGLAPGAYEIRGYFDWPRGAYDVQARAAIEVRGTPVHGAPSLATSEAEYPAHRAIEVSFTRFSGAQHDWITIAPAGSPQERYGEWHFTSGVRDGRAPFEGLPPGDYEVRGYFDWPTGGYAPRAMQRFRVVESTAP